MHMYHDAVTAFDLSAVPVLLLLATRADASPLLALSPPRTVVAPTVKQTWTWLIRSLQCGVSSCFQSVSSVQASL